MKTIYLHKNIAIKKNGDIYNLLDLNRSANKQFINCSADLTEIKKMYNDYVNAVNNNQTKRGVK